MNKQELTVVVSCSIVPAQLKGLLDNLAATAPVSRVELILVSQNGYDYSSLASAHFGSVKNIHFDPQAGHHTGLAKAVASASTEIIVFLEDHVRIESGWLNTLIGIYATGDYSAVGWTIKPGNEHSTVSWAGFLAEYGYWGPGLESGELHDLLPGHNSSYRRDVLLTQGSELSSLLRAESILHWKLLEEGHRVYFTADFACRHYQFLSMSKFLLANFWYAWNFADARCRRYKWGLPRRLFYAIAILLKPLLRWRVLIRTPRDPRFHPRGILWKCSIPITAAFVIASIGETFCYLFGFWRKAIFRIDYYELGFDRGIE